ncbi:hypothetical protein BH11VER1_BH11VER1_01650 [soil metagenome]
MNDFISDIQSREIMTDLASILPDALGRVSLMLESLPMKFENEEKKRARWEPVFTGGSIVSLLLSDPAAPPPSRTKDIDLVLEIASYEEFTGMETALHTAGFTQTSFEDVMVAWQWKGVRVDFLPHKPNPLMTTNRWFPYLIEEAEWIEILSGKFIWRASAPCFLATKFEAFFSRGKGDYVMSKDMEDIIAVIDGRPELIDEVLFCNHDVRGFVARCCRELLTNRRFMDCLPQIVPDDNREMIVMTRMNKLAEAS